MPAGLVPRAAAELGVDPTTVSRRVARLERAVGQTLLIRERAGPRLTEAGRRLLAEAVERTAATLATPELGDADDALTPVLAKVTIRRSFWRSTRRDTRALDQVDRLVTWLVDLSARRQRQLLGG